MFKFNKGLLAMVAIVALGPLNAAPLSTAFTYQGNLSDNGSLANGDYDFEFELWDAPSGGGQIGLTETLDDIAVSGGIFTVELDYGDAPFVGDDRWLLVRVRDGASTGGYTELLPRQPLTPTPFALHAEFVPAGSITNQEIDSSTVQARIINTCTVGQYVQAIDAAGNQTCVTETDPVFGAWDKSSGVSITESQVSDLSHTVDTDTDTTYSDGTGIVLTGTTFSADESVMQTRVGGTCGPGTYLSGINQDGSVQCTPLFVAQQFRECVDCPLMINIPAGTFQMGQEGVTDATPVHAVMVPAFAMGVYEVTFEEWDACVTAGGCNTFSPSDETWGRGTRPVINVSWDDAHAYIGWLNSTTGGGYRLPSESEWEYAARAGTVTDYWFGDDIGVNQANCYAAQCGDSFTDLTAPVHTFAANAFGLFNVHGNVREWVEDWWNADYSGAPDNGDPWLSGDSSLRVLRGGSWNYNPFYLRSADRTGYGTTTRIYNIGFRIAQDQN